ncbi:MAG TPA: tryptophan-rich sensory protein [Humibacillus xanthopallidus]|nr:tryptophan-rich sensory protein [Humibacillus xanthopallidus]
MSDRAAATPQAPADNPPATPPRPGTATLTTTDRVRRIAVVVAEVLCVLGTLVGVGVLGTRVEESSGGALAATATLIAPATPAFSIWSVIYLGLFAYAVWQLPARHATRGRVRSTGWLAAASMVLNAAWLLVTQQGWIWVSVVVILALAVVLGLLVVRLGAEPARSWPERIVLDWTFGLYLGWVAVATCANVTAALVDSGVDLGAPGSQVAAVVVLAVAGGLGVVFARRLGARWAIALAMAWGLAWIAVGRLTSEPSSVATGIAAAAAAVVVLMAVWVTRRAQPHLTAAPAGSAAAR